MASVDPMNGLTVAESMAIAVLKGDYQAALALADWLAENHTLTAQATRIEPTRTITVPRDRLRIILHLTDGVSLETYDREGSRAAVNRWLDGDASDPLVLVGVDQMELYELPAGFNAREELIVRGPDTPLTTADIVRMADLLARTPMTVHPRMTMTSISPETAAIVERRFFNAAEEEEWRRRTQEALDASRRTREELSSGETDAET